jgi:hypothetical protein
MNNEDKMPIWKLLLLWLLLSVICYALFLCLILVIHSSDKIYESHSVFFGYNDNPDGRLTVAEIFGWRQAVLVLFSVSMPPVLYFALLINDKLIGGDNHE